MSASGLSTPLHNATSRYTLSSMTKATNKQQVHFWFEPSLVERMRKICEPSEERPYTPSLTQLAARGAKLACDEAEKLNGATSKKK